jgi:hypothetical protein
LYGQGGVSRLPNRKSSARIGSGTATHHLVEYQRAVFQRLHALAHRAELVAVGPELLLVPAGPDAGDGATVADDVERGPALGQHRRFAVGSTGDQRPDANSLRARRERREGDQALQLGPGSGGVPGGVPFVRGREVVLVPDGFETLRLREPRDGEHPVEGALLPETPVGLYLQTETHR